MDKILKEHQTTKGIIKTVLLSSGKYGAFKDNPNDFILGSTRNEALNNYLSS